MDTWYELWNVRSGNLIATYDSLSSAKHNLKRTAAIRPTSWFEGKELIVEHADDAEPETVAEGMDLYSWATSAPAGQPRTLRVRSIHVVSAASKTAPAYTGDPFRVRASGNWSGRINAIPGWSRYIQGNAVTRISNTHEYQG